MSQFTTTEPPMTPVEQAHRRTQWLWRGALLILILWFLFD